MDEFVQIRLDGSTVLKVLACLRDGDRIGADRAVRGCVVQPDRTGARARFLDEASEIIGGFVLRKDEIDEASELHAYRVAYRNLLKDLDIAESEALFEAACRIHAEQELELYLKKLDELHSSLR